MKFSTACIVSDDGHLREQIEAFLHDRFGCRTSGYSVGDWSTDCFPAEHSDVVFLDLRTRQTQSPLLWQTLQLRLDILPKLAAVAVVAIVEDGYPIEQAKLADILFAGAICWPCATDSLEMSLSRMQPRGLFTTALEGQCVRSEQREFRTYTPSLFPVLERLDSAARHDFTILIVGETGTGKTTLAAMIHELSHRKEHRFLTVACGTLPGELIDSELFGHVKGAFTGADRTKSGKFDAAGEGSILLDEIDVLGAFQQAKLLRVLETGEYEMVGSNDTLHSRCRTLVASNVDLELLIEQRRFRADLYFRLNQMKFCIPPLRERPLDIVPLAVDFIDECRREHNLPVTHIHTDFLQVLKHYSWPGNIRQLRNEVRRAVVFSQAGVVMPDALSLEVLAEAAEKNGQHTPHSDRSVLADRVATTERQLIEQMLKKQDFNRAATARALGISRVTLYNKLKKLGISSREANSTETGEV